jgi:hypothetical protein
MASMARVAVGFVIFKRCIADVTVAMGCRSSWSTNRMAEMDAG